MGIDLPSKGIYRIYEGADPASYTPLTGTNMNRAPDALLLNDEKLATLVSGIVGYSKVYVPGSTYTKDEIVRSGSLVYISLKPGNKDLSDTEFWRFLWEMGSTSTESLGPGTAVTIDNGLISVSLGTTSETAAAGDDDRIVNAVQKTDIVQNTGQSTTYIMSQKAVTDALSSLRFVPVLRSITAGTGLTGGGTLDADRTLSVKYGTTAGTAMEGNNPRVANALQNSDIVQSTGQSTTKVMSQKAVTDALGSSSSGPGGVPDQNGILFSPSVKDVVRFKEVQCTTPTFSATPASPYPYDGRVFAGGMSCKNPSYYGGQYVYYSPGGISIGHTKKVISLEGTTSSPSVRVHGGLNVEGAVWLPNHGLLASDIGANDGFWGRQILIRYAQSSAVMARIDITGIGTFVDVNITSDKRRKRDLTRIDSALSKLDRINGYTYEVSTGGEGWTKGAGVVAQELLEVLPEVVSYDEESDKYTVKYSGVVAMLVESIKELSSEVNILKSELARMTNE